jgi:hypothetical protein
MKKKLKISNSDEIYLGEFFQILWVNKIKFFTTVLISFLISMSFFYIKLKKEDLYESSIIINPSETYQFIKFEKINKFFIDNIEDNKKFYFGNYVPINKNSVLKRAINELQKLDDYQKLFKIESLNKSQYILKIILNDKKNSRDAIEKVLRIASANLEKKIFKELNEFFEIKKKMTIDEDSKRLKFLLEQSSISKKIDLEFNIHKASDFSSYDKAYFLIGYKPIDEEIRIIQNRNYEELIQVQNDINLLKNMNTQWFNYRVDLINTIAIYKVSEQIVLFSILSIILGLMVGVMYILITKMATNRNI